MNTILRNKRAFTLIELIVVIAILGILAAILVPSISNYTERSDIRVCEAEAKAFQATATRVLYEISIGVQLDGKTFQQLMLEEGYGTVNETATGDKYIVHSGMHITSAKWTTKRGYVCIYDGSQWSEPVKP